MKNILVAEDELSTRALYQEVFLQMGHLVHCVRDGIQAVKYFKEQRPDLVILDVKMPRMHGFDALEKIRDIDRTTPVIICSAYPKLRNDPAVMTMDVFDFIDKPINIDRLRKTAEEALGLRETPAAAKARGSAADGAPHKEDKR